MGLKRQSSGVKEVLRWCLSRCYRFIRDVSSCFYGGFPLDLQQSLEQSKLCHTRLERAFNQRRLKNLLKLQEDLELV